MSSSPRSLKSDPKESIHADISLRDSDSITYQVSTSTSMETSSASLPASTPPLSTLKTRLAFLALCLSIFLVALDGVLIPTALPSISKSFEINDQIYAWIGSAYYLANAVSIPLWGKMADVFGRKPILQLSNLLFLAGSLVCATSRGAVVLVAGRAMQGLGGGGIVGLVYICVSDLFEIQLRSGYLGTLGGVWAVASALGPVLSGVFAEKVNWRYCFYVNLPIIGISMTIIQLTLKLDKRTSGFLAGLCGIDWLGTFSIVGATLALLIGLQLGNSDSFTDAKVIVLLAIAPVLYLIFPFIQIWTSKQGRSGIMPLHIFRDISNLSALLVCSFDALVFNSVAYFLPLYFQIVLAKSPLTTGVLMLAIAIPLAVISSVSGHIIDKTGRFREILQCGLLVMTLGVGLLNILGVSPSLAAIICILVVIGLGFGPNFGAPLIALQSRTEEHDMATGTAAFGFVRMVSGAMGVVIGQVVFQRILMAHYQALLDSGLESEFAHQITSGQAVSQAEVVPRLTLNQQVVVRRNFMIALRGVWIVYTVIGGLGFVVSFGIKRSKLDQISANESSNTQSVENSSSKVGD